MNHAPTKLNIESKLFCPRRCDLFGKHGGFKEYERMGKLSRYGLSADAIADVPPKGTRTMSTGREQESRSISWRYLLIDNIDCAVYTDG